MPASYAPPGGKKHDWFSSIGGAEFWAPESIIPMGLGLLTSAFDQPDAMLAPWYEQELKSAVTRSMGTANYLKEQAKVFRDQLESLYGPQEAARRKEAFDAYETAKGASGGFSPNDTMDAAYKGSVEAGLTKDRADREAVWNNQYMDQVMAAQALDNPLALDQIANSQYQRDMIKSGLGQQRHNAINDFVSMILPKSSGYKPPVPTSLADVAAKDDYGRPSLHSNIPRSSMWGEGPADPFSNAAHWTEMLRGFGWGR